MRFPTLISTVQADERRAERLEKLRPSVLSPSSAQEQQKQKQPADVSGTDVADATGSMSIVLVITNTMGNDTRKWIETTCH